MEGKEKTKETSRQTHEHTSSEQKSKTYRKRLREDNRTSVRTGCGAKKPLVVCPVLHIAMNKSTKHLQLMHGMLCSYLLRFEVSLAIRL